MIEYTVHFERGKFGGRSLRMVTVEADCPDYAVRLAKAQFPSWREQRYRVTRVDHFDAHNLVIDL